MRGVVSCSVPGPGSAVLSGLVVVGVGGVVASEPVDGTAAVVESSAEAGSVAAGASTAVVISATGGSGLSDCGVDEGSVPGASAVVRAGESFRLTLHAGDEHQCREDGGSENQVPFFHVIYSFRWCLFGPVGYVGKAEVDNARKLCGGRFDLYPDLSAAEEDALMVLCA